MLVRSTRGLMIALAVVPLCNAAEAQGTPPTMPSIFGYVAVGLASVPRTAGSRQQQLIPYVGVRVQSGRRYVSFDGLDARMNVLESSHVEFGPAAALTFGRDTADIHTVRGPLPRIANSIEAGAFVAVSWDDVLRRGADARLSLQSVRGVSGVHDGWVSTVKASYSLPVGQRLVVTADGSFRVVSEAFAGTFFGVTPTASVASGLSPFDASGGAQQAGASVMARYGMTRAWSLAGFATLQRLVGDAGRSPIVVDVGRRNQLTAGFGIARSF